MSRTAALVLVAIGIGCDAASVFHPPAEAPAALVVGLSEARASRAQPDAARIRVTAAGGPVLFDDTVTFAATGEVRIRVEIDLAAETQSVDVLVELFEAGRLVERGSETVTLTKGQVTTASVFADDIADNLAVGPTHACYLDAAGDAYCWGSGPGTGLDPGVGAPATSRPVRVASGTPFIAITAGSLHTCGLADNGTAHCWGANGVGQLGDGTATARYQPVPVSGGPVFTRVTAGHTHTCGLTDTGEAWCWGGNTSGELGISPVGSGSPIPVRVDTQLRFDDLQAAFTNTCGLVAGEVWCWGRDFGVRGSQADPVPRQKGGGPYGALGPGVAASCVLTVTGAAECWGAELWTYGQLGNGTLSSSPSPVPVSGGITFHAINSASANNIFTAHVCGLDPAGLAWCWGINRYGELGSSSAADSCPVIAGPAYGTTFSCSLVPVPVTTSERFATIDLGLSYSCALSHAGQVYCWGRGKAGELGNGDLDSRSAPAPVGSPTSPPVVTAFDLVLGQTTVAVGDSIAGFQRFLDQNGNRVPTVAQIAVSDSAVARVQFGGDLPQVPAGGFHVYGLSRGSAVLTATIAGIDRQVTVTVN